MAELEMVAKEFDMTLCAAAIEAGVSTSSAYRMKHGGGVCSAETLCALAAWAGINPTKYSLLKEAA